MTRQRSLLTPGPLSLSLAVRSQMQRDLASRDDEFKEVTACMRRLMLNLLGNAEDYSVVPIQGVAPLQWRLPSLRSCPGPTGRSSA